MTQLYDRPSYSMITWKRTEKSTTIPVSTTRKEPNTRAFRPPVFWVRNPSMAAGRYRTRGILRNRRATHGPFGGALSGPLGARQRPGPPAFAGRAGHR